MGLHCLPSDTILLVTMNLKIEPHLRCRDICDKYGTQIRKSDYFEKKKVLKFC